MLSDWISDYSIVRCDRARRTGGGVAMMIRKTVNYTTILSESFPKGYEILALDFAAPELLIYPLLHALLFLSKEPTRGENILDLVLTNDQHLINNIAINSALGQSDHSSISFDITASLPPCLPVFKRLFHKCDYSRVLSYLSSILWVESFETLSTVDDKYSMFLSILNHTIDQFVPGLSSIRISATYRNIYATCLNIKNACFNMPN
ncbi:hypothetical protein COOONC_22744 [Cooperia oncophora]